jgi:hypothetical protein
MWLLKIFQLLNESKNREYISPENTKQSDGFDKNFGHNTAHYVTRMT